MRLNINNIMKFKPHELLGKINGLFEVEYDDGVVLELTAHDIILEVSFMVFCLEHNMKYESRFSIIHTYSMGAFNSNSHKDFCGKVYRVYIHEYIIPQGRLSHDAMEAAWKTDYNILQYLYSTLQYLLIEYGCALSLHDYAEIQNNEKLLEAIEATAKDSLNPMSVAIAGDVLKDLMLDPKYRLNNLVMLYKSGAVNRTQIAHSLATRGFVTDINNMIQSNSVNDNLIKGLNTFYDMMCEAYVMMKAMMLQDDGVKYSEWLQRELHMASMVIRKVTLDDCGSRDYKEWLLIDDKELFLLSGTNILLDGVEVELYAPDHKHLVGEVILIRRVNECRHLKDGAICSRCLGGHTYGIAEGTSPAIKLITLAMVILVQMQLGAKHLTDSSLLSAVVLDTVTAMFFSVRDSILRLKADIHSNARYKYKLLINTTAYHGFRLLSINMLNRIDSLDVNKLSRIDNMQMEVYDTKTGEILRHHLPIKKSGRSGILDKEFIIHSLTHTTMLTSGEYAIDLTGYTGDVLFLENREFSTDEFSDDFKRMLGAFGKGKKKTSVDDAIHTIFRFLNSKIEVDIKIVEILIAALTIEDRSDMDYSIGLDDTTRQVVGYGEVIRHRGIVALGFEEQRAVLTEVPHNYVNTAHMYHPLEAVWNFKTIIE